MAGSNYWFERVMQKLRAHLLSGEPSAGYEWQYDTETTKAEEDKSLVLLESQGVLETRLNDMKLSVEANGSLLYNGDNTDGWTRTIIGFTPAAYEKVCARHGIEPYSELYNAQLNLLDDVIPVVTVGADAYNFRSMYEGKAAIAIRYCYKNIGSTITLKELREAGVKPLTNIPQVFKDSHFSKTGALAPFVQVTPATISLHDTASLSQEQFALIRSASKSSS